MSKKVLKEVECTGSEGMKKSTEYYRFKFFPWNRDVPEDNLAKIKDSMVAEGGSSNTFPITVIKRGNDYYIADGQTRYTAEKELGYIVYYAIDNVPDPYDDNAIFLKYTKRNATQKGWPGKTFLDTKIKLGNESAIWMGNLLDQNPWLTFSCLEVLIDTKGKTFVKGNIGNGFNNVDTMLRSHVSEFFIEYELRLMVEDALTWINPVLKDCKNVSRDILAAIMTFKNAEGEPIRQDRLNMILLRDIEKLRTLNGIDKITNFLFDAYISNNKKEDGEITWVRKDKKISDATIKIWNKGGVINIYN